MKKTTLLIILTLVLIGCKNIPDEVGQSFAVINEKVAEENIQLADANKKLMQRVMDSAMSNPAVYASAFNHSNEFHNKTDLLITSVEKVKNEVYDHIGTVDDNSKQDHTDAVFFIQEQPSQTATFLLESIKNYNITTPDQLFFFPVAEKRAQQAFNLESITNREGNSVDWLAYNFKDVPTIAAIARLNMLQNDAYEIEQEFLQALLLKPQF